MFTEWLNEPPALAMSFVDGLTSPRWISEFITTRMTPAWEAGCVPLVTWLPLAATENGSSEHIASDIAAGEYDSLIENWAAQLSNWAVADEQGETLGRRFYFRPAHEMNGNWFPWSAAASVSTADDYVAMWQRIHDIFARTALDETTIQWMWAPNADEVGGIQAEAYYPGDAYVDWVGLDGFNFGGTQWYSEWRTPEDVFLDMLRRMRNLTDKPAALTEFASSSYRDGASRPAAKAAWIEDAFAFVGDHDIRMTCWFNVEKSGADEADWAVFGSQRGTATEAIDGETYNTYDSYRATVNSPAIIHGNTNASPHLTEQEFRGEFRG
ncbi:MAG TPA: glycosyl hydrolase [Halococcus sp.]|nr:glycosyl hydrolase [Halococcus sp.]